MSSPRRSIIIFLLTAFLGFSVVGGFFTFPKDAHAQWIVSDVGNAAINTAKWTWERLKDAFAVIRKNFADVAFKNALKTYLTAIAEDTATWVASAGTGQKPLFITDPKYFSKLNDAAVGDFLDSLTAPTALGEEKKCVGGTISGNACTTDADCERYGGKCQTVQRIGSVFGQSICDPGPVKIQIDLALRSQLNPNFCQDNCNDNYRKGQQQMPVVIGDAGKNFTLFLPAAEVGLTQLQKLLETGEQPDEVLCDPNWPIVQCITFYTSGISKAKQKLQDDLKLCLNLCSAGRRRAKCTLSQIKDKVGTLTPIEVTGNLPKIFKPSENPLGQYLTLFSEANKAAAKKVQQERDVAAGLVGSIGPTRTTVSGETKTPQQLTEEAARANLANDPSGSAFGIYTGSPIADAIGVFTNTLTKKLMDRIFRCGLNPATCFEGGGGGGTRVSLGPGGSLSGGFNSSGIAAARASFASSFTPDLSDNTQVDILTELQEKKLIDPVFRDAIDSGLTVLEATQTSPPKLDRNKPFGFSKPAADLSKSVEPDAGSGYPYRALLYLRKYRIIPVTWEIAAEYIGRNLTAPVTLGKLIDCYNDSVNDDCKPFDRLIDPNWVLKVPALQCARKGFSEEIVPGSCHAEPIPLAPGDVQELQNVQQATVQVCQREETCVDDQSCVVESPDGKGCREWGYCAAEKPIWRFTGTGCDSQYNGCQTYVSENGQEASYVKDTLTTNACSATNVGCQRYCRPGYCAGGAIPGATCTENADCRGGGTCDTAYDASAAAWESSCTIDAPPLLESVGDKIQLDRDAEQCASQDEGCSRFLRMSTGNLLRNPSFETHAPVDVAGGRENFTGWIIGGSDQTCGAQAFPETGSLFGATAVKLQQLPACVAGGDARQYMYQAIPLGKSPANRTFTWSYSARSIGGACTGLSQFAVSVVPPHYSPGVNVAYTDAWQRFSETHTFPSMAGNSLEVVVRLPATCSIVIDGFQVEEAGSASAFKDYGSGNDIHLKAPPAYLSCTGNLSTDPAACSNFALRCNAGEVGCEKYTPLTGGFGEGVNGTVTNPLSAACVNSDFKDPSCSQCPSQFVGCQAFQEVKLTNNPPDPNNAVRTGYRCANDNSRSCTDPSDTSCGPGIACLNTLSIIPASGRRCTAADVGCEEYTNLDVVAKGGEGKEYYKQVRQCVSVADTTPFYSWEGSDRTGFQLKLHRLKKSNVNNGPCTNLAVSSNPNAPCVDDTSPLLPRATCTVDPANLDCVRFYEQGGTTHELLLSRTIVGSDTCIPYRNTLDTATYYFDGKLSQQCSASAAGCREYKGNAGNNIRVIFSDSFEDGTDAGWTNAVNSNESLNFGGHSLKVTGGRTEKSVTGITPGKAYILSFWAKDSGGVLGVIPTVAFDTGESFGNISLTTNWQRFEFGPVTVGTTAPTTLQMGGFDSDTFLDNITLTEISDSAYLIRNSYQFCQGYENCSAYQDRAGNTHFLKSFQSLCPAEKVGCEALIATQNSASPFEEKFRKNPDRGDVNADGRIDQADVEYLNSYVFRSGPAPEPLALGDVTGDVTVDLADVVQLARFVNTGDPALALYPDSFLTVPEDRVTYLVNDPGKSCSAGAKGCGRFGIPAVDPDANITGYDTAFRRDDPDTYATTLCQGDQVGCSAYTLADTQGQAFFKDPGQRLCEYRENVGASKLTGWFKAGTDDPCPASSWTHLCPAQQSSCSLYTAPTAYPNPVGGETNYHYLASTVPQGECPAGLDPKIGCLAFHVDSESSGNNTLRPNINPQDNTVLSQSCQLCNPNAATCGRYGGAACCTWDSARCSIEKSAGDDGLEPLYCLYETPAGNKGCAVPGDLRIAGTGGWVMPNDDTNPTNCQFVPPDPEDSNKPNCFKPDLSDYDPALRLCSDFSCTANTVLKVQRDRVCGEWLKCANEQVVTNDQGKQTTVCLERKLCKADPGGAGTCTFVADNEFPHQLIPPANVDPANLDVASPADVDKLANISGYSRAGLLVVGKTLDGYLVYDQMSETGVEGTDVDVPNGDFEAVQRRGTKDEVTEPPEKDVNFSWKDDGVATIRLEKVTPQDNFANQTLRIISHSSGENGAFVEVSRDLFTEGASYLLSFDGRTDGTPTKAVTVLLRQKQGAATPTLFGPASVTVTNTWQHYIVELVDNPSGSLKLAGSVGQVELAFLHASKNLPNESFSIDNASLKPVLKIQDNPAYVSRQCRSYPKDSAARCEFTDEQSGVNYRGWRGYCVERDPKDPKTCLNWWPVDLIAGEANVFGESEKSLTRAPLFYCAAIKGNANQTQQVYRDTNLNSGVPNVCNGSSCDNFSAGANTGYRYYVRNEILALASFGNSSTYCTDKNPFTSTNCADERRLFCNVADACAWDVPVTCPSSAPECNYKRDEVENITFQFIGNNSDASWPSVSLNYQDSNPDSDTLVADRSGQSPVDPNCWVSKNSADYSQPGYDPVNRMALTVCWKDNGTFDHYRVDMKDGSSGSTGGDVPYAAYFTLRESCTDLVQVATATGKSKPWAAKVVGGFDGLSDPDPAKSGKHPLFYQEETSCSPYGATPVIKSPDDIKVCQPKPGKTCIPDPNCSDTVNCELVNAPLEIYTPTDSMYGGKNNICTQTILGNGFSACFGNGTCGVCSSGAYMGLNCVTSSDCGVGVTCTWQKTCIGGANDRRACESNADCAGFNCAVRSPASEPLSIAPDIYPNKATGISRLKQLFVQSYGLWRWDLNERRYVPVSGFDWTPPQSRCPNDVRPGAGLTGDAFRAKDAYCFVPPKVTDVKVTASDKTYDTGQVVLSGSNHTITLTYKLQADEEQQPIRRITIDWGDGVPRSGYVGTSATKTYFCPADPTDPRSCGSCSRGADPQSVVVNGQTVKACIYTPAISARDNWGRDSDKDLLAPEEPTPFNGTIEVLP